jgi:hypothetical protein
LRQSQTGGVIVAKIERKKQTCKVCGEPLLLTEITIDTGKKIWAYMCGCDDMVRQAKQGEQD